jgi:acyl dehydratase
MTAVTDFDPDAFLIVPARTFEDLRIGEVFISFVEQSCTFLAEVHSGDTLYSTLTITGLEPKGDDGIVITAATVHNQRGQLVLSGQHK